jgi:predicted O-methyltransferase YrrM
VALAIADPRRTVTSLDPFPYPTREEYLRMAPRSALDRIELVQEFGEVEPSVRDVEFLFIDASHRRELTVQTFRAWQPALAPGAIVAFHDYDNAAHPGVNAAIADLGLEGEVHGDIFAWHAG